MSNITYGLDWLSATTGDDSLGQKWFEAYCGHTRKIGRMFEEDIHLQGGYTGLKNESWTWGYSKSLRSYFLQGTGAEAGNIASAMSGTGCKYTRVDLRVDVVLTQPDVDVAGRGYDENKGRERPTYRLIDKSGVGGQTLYVGSLASDRFARLYDKGAERGYSPGLWWRYEVVIRKPHANKVMEQIHLGGIIQVPSLVHTWFSERGIQPVYSASASAIAKADKAQTTAEQKLAWLRKSVRPVVARLVGGGLAQEVFEALDLTQPRRP